MDYTRELEGFTLKIEQDDFLESSREWDNLGKMICFHKHYNLGDNHKIKHSDFNSWDELYSYLESEYQAEIILPLYLYDHSEITMNTIGFSCPWDSGQVGFIYMTKHNRIENKLSIEQAKECLKAEVETYDKYLRGEVYFFQIVDENNLIVDSCGGFYGEQFAINEGESSLKYCIEDRHKSILKIPELKCCII